MRPAIDAPIELYNLETDLSETTNISDQYPSFVNRLNKLMDEAHTDNPEYISRSLVAQE